MKTLLLALILILAATPAFSASYYGCASAAINADNTFCDTPTGSCTGSNPQTAATVLAGTHNLYANGCTISIPNTANATFTAAKISNKDDGGDMVDGGQFTYTTSNTYAVVLQASIETGGTTGAALAISGSGTQSPALTIGSSGTPVTITAGSAASMQGISDVHTVGKVIVYGNVTAGSNASAVGIRHNAATGTLDIIGNVTGGSIAAAYGINVAGTANATVTGDCIGSDSALATGCYASSTGTITVTGNLIYGSGGANAIGGPVIWTPGASNYVKVTNGTAVYASKAPSTTKVLPDTSVVNATSGAYEAGTAAAGAAGAWGW